VITPTSKLDGLSVESRPGRLIQEFRKRDKMYTYTNSRARAFYLNQRSYPTKKGGIRIMRYFSAQPSEHTIEIVPDGYVIEEAKNGLPLLKRAV